MILQVNEDTIIDVDQISMLHKPTGLVVVAGFACRITEDEFDVVLKAYKYRHKLGRYDHNLNKIDPKGE